ncbi:hypothetical protein ACOSQ2_031018 [Xanthoceras sorbifolium]
MVVFMIIAVVTARLDTKCYRDCCLGCYGGRVKTICFEFCYKSCQVRPRPSNALHHNCTLSCSKSKCANFTSDDFDKATGCLDSCIEECKKNN